MISTQSHGYMACHVCGLVYEYANISTDHFHCGRCGAVVHRRKPNSVARTWALLAAAGVLFIPANVLPIMTVIQFGSAEPDTILTGVAKLADAGLWPLALLVFLASIVIPMLKILAIAYLVTEVQRGSDDLLRAKTNLYRVIEFVGRWSMVDIFMVSILIAIVRLGNLALIEPGAGAMAFACVVILTMFASASFDPRLMWDNVDKQAA